jgi:predicted Zn finger-like uncharacterized protein
MDVRCARCSTEYEFDDALVSERGTTVKCTNCGYQFKVFPGGAGSGPERWIVRKASGRELVYTSLKELQRAISQRQVGPTDMLSRGGGQPLRPLGDIAELEPFFNSQVSAHQPVQRTLLGMHPVAANERREDDTVRDAGPPFASTMQSHRAVAPGSSTRRTPAPAPPARPPPAPAPVPRPYDEEFEPRTVPRHETPEPSTVNFQRGVGPSGGRQPEPDYAPAPPPVAPSPPREVRVREASPARPNPQLTPTPSAVSEGYRAYEERHTDPRYLVVPERPSKARWVVGLIVFGALGFAGATVGRKYLERLSTKEVPPAVPAVADERVTKMLEAARKHFYDGDLEEAKEQLDKASMLEEKNPKIHAAIARLEAARADVHWLAIRLQRDEGRRDAAKKRLETRLKKLDEAVKAAVSTKADDPDVVRARIDHLRLSGKVEEARKLIDGVATTMGDPETSYVLAALDLAEDAPAWTTVIDRLRAAAGVESGLGRARAALVYALAKSGNRDGAQTELDALGGADDTHSLYNDLKAFLEETDLVIQETTEEKSLEPSAPVGKAPRGEPGGAPAAGNQDFRTILTEASRAKASGDMGRARALYSQALEKAPGNVEAMTGLADVARAQGDSAVATRYYDQALASNPSYQPALMARADMKWAAGDRAGAVAMYRRVVQESGAGSSYGQRAQKRITEHEGGGSSPPASEDVPPPAPQPPATPPPSDTSDKPHIDTSDLPGFNQ